MPGAGPGRPRTGPATPTERRLLAIWSQILPGEVGTTGSVFTIGGNSLTALRMLTRVQGEFGLKLRLRQLIGNPTVVALAAVIDEALASG
jgi:hypothetical protein